MKRKFSLINKSIFYFIVSMLVMNVSIMAQDENEQKQIQAIQEEINNIYGKKMEAVLKNDRAQYNKMDAEAKSIEKMKEEQGKKKAVENYQNAHKGYYKKMMNSAGVNINSVLAHLKKKFPEYTFTSSDGISINLEKKTETVSPESQGMGPIDGANIVGVNARSSISGPHLSENELLPNPIQENITLASSKKINCSLISGGSVTFPSSNSMGAASFATIAGGCDASGIMERSFTVPTNIRSFKVVLSGSADHYGYAIGIGGSAMANTKTYIYITLPSKTLYKFYLSKTKVAPILWAGGYNETVNIYRTAYLSSYKSQSVRIRAVTYSYSISVLPSATKSNCQLNLPTLVKVYERL